jgi:hypothetical protein
MNPEWRDFAEHWERQILMPNQSIREESERQQRRIQLRMDSSPPNNGSSE